MSKSLNIKSLVSFCLTVFLVFLLILLIGRVLIPFVTGIILAYIFNPIVNFCGKYLKLPRKYCAFGISMLLLLLIAMIPFYVIPALIDQANLIMSKLPEIVHALNNTILVTINHKFGTYFMLDLNKIQSSALWITSIKKVESFSDLVAHGMTLVEIVVYLVLIPFALFYSISGWNKIERVFYSIIPRQYVKNISSLLSDIDSMLSAYLRAQIMVMLVMAAYYAIALNIIHVQSATVVGIITGLLVFIPYLGILSGLLILLITNVVGFTSISDIIPILVVFGIGHVFEGAIVTPFLVGGRIGLNPVMTIMSLMIFAKLFGIIGVLLALPLSTIAVVVVRHAYYYYVNSKYYKEQEES